MATSITPAHGKPSERLQALLLSTNPPTPYEVTDQIVVTPPTKARRQRMTEATMSIAVQQSLLAEAMNHVLAARPEYPSMPTPPAPGASKAVYAAYESAAAHFDSLVAAWENLNDKWEASVDDHQRVVQTISDRITADSEEYTKALFGDAYEAVIAYFDDQDAGLWQAFQDDIQYHFKLAVRPPQVPESGVCEHCGSVVDPEAAGKASASSD